MILDKSIFMKVDDETYHVSYVGQSESSNNKPQEWTCSLNPVIFELKNVVFENTHHIHDSIYNSGISKNAMPSLNYYSKIYNRPSILGVVDDRLLKDTIYHLVQEGENDGWLCKKFYDSITVVIRPGSLVKNGTEDKIDHYPGSCFLNKMDNIYQTMIEVTIPEHKFNEILDYLSNHPVSRIRMCIYLQSYNRITGVRVNLNFLLPV